MCPHITSSCCTPKDQEIIFQNWITNLEEAGLKQKIANYTTALNGFFEIAANVTQKANAVLDVFSSSINNECSLMARRILTYQIEDSSTELNDMFNRTYNFLATAHKGAYCALCNAKLGEFWQTSQKKTVISERFCRDLLVTGLPTALYLNSHLPRYISLLVLFMTNCDKRGQFTKKSAPANLIPSIDATLEGNLKGCFTGKNGADWATPCVPVCEAYQIGSIPKMFTPDLKVYNETKVYLTAQLAEFDFDPSKNATNGTNSTSGNGTSVQGSVGGQPAGASAAAPAGQPAQPPSSGSRILRSKSPPKHKKKALRRYDHEERRLPRRLQNETPNPATAPAAGSSTTDNGAAAATPGTPATPADQNATAASNATAKGPIQFDPSQPLIYGSMDPAAALNFDTWTSSVRVYGIHFFESGLFSEISQEKAKSLRALLKARKLKRTPKASRRLNSQGLLSSLTILVLMLILKN
jgi:hypothetical protein